MSNDESVPNALDNTKRKSDDEQDSPPIKKPKLPEESNNMDDDDHDGRNEATEQDFDDASYDKFGAGIDDKPKLDHSPPQMEIQPPIHRLPNELLIKIVEKIPRAQWPVLELIDKKFRDATMLAWESLREVDVERDFHYSERDFVPTPESDFYDIAAGCSNEYGWLVAGLTKSVLDKLYERSPLITSLSGVSFLIDNTVDTAIIQRLSEFQHLESIKFADEPLRGYFHYGSYKENWSRGIRLVNLIEFIESTRSRAVLKEIIVRYCYIPDDAIANGLFERLRVAFGNDPSRALLKLETLSMGFNYEQNVGYYLPQSNFIDTIDTSRLATLDFGDMPIEPDVLTALINRAPELRRLEIAIVPSCYYLGESSTACQGGRLQANEALMAAVETRQNLTSLGLSSIRCPLSNGHHNCACQQFDTSFFKMLNTIGPQLEKFDFEPGHLPIFHRMGEVLDIVQKCMPRLKSITLRGGAVCSADLQKIADYLTAAVAAVKMIFLDGEKYEGRRCPTNDCPMQWLDAVQQFIHQHDYCQSRKGLIQYPTDVNCDFRKDLCKWTNGRNEFEDDVDWRVADRVVTDLLTSIPRGPSGLGDSFAYIGRTTIPLVEKPLDQQSETALLISDVMTCQYSSGRLQMYVWKSAIGGQLDVCIRFPPERKSRSLCLNALEGLTESGWRKVAVRVPPITVPFRFVLRGRLQTPADILAIDQIEYEGANICGGSSTLFDSKSPEAQDPPPPPLPAALLSFLAERTPITTTISPSPSIFQDQSPPPDVRVSSLLKINQSQPTRGTRVETVQGRQSLVKIITGNPYDGPSVKKSRQPGENIVENFLKALAPGLAPVQQQTSSPALVPASADPEPHPFLRTLSALFAPQPPQPQPQPAVAVQQPQKNDLQSLLAYLANNQRQLLATSTPPDPFQTATIGGDLDTAIRGEPFFTISKGSKRPSAILANQDELQIAPDPKPFKRPKPMSKPRKHADRDYQPPESDCRAIECDFERDYCQMETIEDRRLPYATLKRHCGDSLSRYPDLDGASQGQCALVLTSTRNALVSAVLATRTFFLYEPSQLEFSYLVPRSSDIKRFSDLREVGVISVCLERTTDCVWTSLEDRKEEAEDEVAVEERWRRKSIRLAPGKRQVFFVFEQLRRGMYMALDDVRLRMTDGEDRAVGNGEDMIAKCAVYDDGDA